MKEHVSKAVRDLLKTYPDGLSVTEIAGFLNITNDGARKSLRHMPDAYIARWELAANLRYMSVWCVVVPPANAVNPETLRPSRVRPRSAPARPARAPESKPSRHAPQGMTQIRGPWPT